MANLLIMDSGIGGLSVFKEVRSKLPASEIHYFADHAASPYGEKEQDWLLNRLVSITTTLIEQIQPDAIVLACNTASTLALDTLRSSTHIPIIGVVPAIKTAANQTQNNIIGILATPITVKGSYLTDLEAQFAKNKEVIRIGSSELVNMAEDKLKGESVDLKKLNDIILPFVEARCDSVVLGCTHFPLLLPELKSINPNINWVDSGEAIAKQTQKVIKQLNCSEHSTSTGKLTFYSSGNEVESFRPQLNRLEFELIHTISI